MFTDPQSITINAVAKSMPRISVKDLSAIYQTSDEAFKLTVSHLKSNKRVRSMSRIDQRAIVVDPLSSENDYDTLSVYTVIDRPEVGFSLTQLDQLVTGYFAWHSPATVARLFGYES